MADERFKQALQYFGAQGIEALTPLQERNVVVAYRRALTDGLTGEPSSLAMNPSRLRPADVGRIKNAHALVVEVGGNHGYAANVTLYEGTLYPQKQITWDLPGKTYSNAESFYESLYSPMTPLLIDQKPDVLAIVFSFSGDAMKTHYGVDIRPDAKLSKEFFIPGISQKLVGQGFRDVLERNHGFSEDLPIAAMNDTVAVADSIGGVIGSGFNLAVNTPYGIVSTESGGFNQLPMATFDLEVDSRTKNPGKQIAEKRISGDYLKLELQVAVEGLRKAKILSEFDIDFKTETITELMKPDSALNKRVDIDRTSRVILSYLARRLIRRSTQLTSLMSIVAMDTFREQFDRPEVVMPIEGSVFWEVPGYSHSFHERVETTTGKIVDLVKGNGRLGAARTALGLLAA